MTYNTYKFFLFLIFKQIEINEDKCQALILAITIFVYEVLAVSADSISNSNRPFLICLINGI